MILSIRAFEPADYEAMQKIFSGPKVVWGTLQLPHPSLELWRKRLAEPPAGMFGLVACIDQELAGQLDIFTFPNQPRRRHVASIEGRAAGPLPFVEPSLLQD